MRRSNVPHLRRHALFFPSCQLYQTINADVKAVFASATEHLTPGGLFVFNFGYSPEVYAQQPAVRVERMVDDQIEITHIDEPVIYPNENWVDVNYTIYSRDIACGSEQTMNVTHPMHHFSLPENDLFAEANGFTRIAAE